MAHVNVITHGWHCNQILVKLQVGVYVQKINYSIPYSAKRWRWKTLANLAN